MCLPNTKTMLPETMFFPDTKTMFLPDTNNRRGSRSEHGGVQHNVHLFPPGHGTTSAWPWPRVLLESEDAMWVWDVGMGCGYEMWVWDVGIGCGHGMWVWDVGMGCGYGMRQSGYGMWVWDWVGMELGGYRVGVVWVWCGYSVGVEWCR